jgi:signal transduction histidine kinase
MKRGRSVKTQLSIAIAFVSLLTISLISFLANYFIQAEFGSYLSSQQKQNSKELVSAIGQSYTESSKSWDVMYIHNIGMYALYDGYIMKVYDLDGKKIWDAEECDLTLCNQVMKDISAQMKSHSPGSKGGFVSEKYDLTRDGKTIGTIDLSYYGPYFLSESDSQFLSALNIILLGTGVFSLAVSILIGFLMARRITRPITKTIDITKQIADGNYEISYDKTARMRELDELMCSVNHLATELSEQEHLRRQMTADISHELRTPLTSVATHLEAMMMGIWEPTQERLNSCHEEILRLTSLVKDLENLTKVESDTLHLNKTEVELKELVETVMDTFLGELQAKQLSYHIVGEKMVVLADKDRIKQVVLNLISNAVKYTPEGGAITAQITGSNVEAAISISDTGIGIPEQEIDRIFERFYRTEKSRSRQTGGAGIGLTIVKSIVEAHGGTVEVSSKEGDGSIFMIRIPK